MLSLDSIPQLFARKNTVTCPLLCKGEGSRSALCEELEWSPTDGEEYLNLVSLLLISKVTVSVLGLGLGLGAHILVDGQIAPPFSAKPSVDASSPRPLPCEELEWSPNDGEEYLNLVSPLLTSKVTVSVLGIDILAQSCKLLPFIAT